MTSFTSVQSGDWNDPATWGTSTTYPGSDTDNDTAIISNSHTVLYNIDNSSSGTNHKMGKITVNSSATLDIDTSQSTYLWTGDTILFNGYQAGIRCGSYSSKLSSSYTFTIEYDYASDGYLEFFDYNENSCRVDLHGADKTQSDFLSATASSAQADITFSSIPSDWAVGDRLVILSSSETGTARYTETEEVTISSISGNTATLTGNLSYSHSAGTLVMNMTRNIRLFATNSSYRPGPLYRNIQMTSENVEFKDIGYYAVFRSGSSNQGPWLVDNCTFSGGDRISQYDSNDGMNFKNCNFYDFTSGFNGVNRTGSLWVKDCHFVSVAQGIVYSGNRAPKWVFEGCTIACSSGYGIYGVYASIDIRGCYFYGLYSYALYPRQNTTQVVESYFGQRQDGSSQKNNAASLRSYDSMIYLTDCVFNDTTMIQTHEADNYAPMYWSTNHNQTFGDNRIYSGNGTLLLSLDTSVYRTSSPSVKMNVARRTTNTPQKYLFKVESGKSYEITLYGKRASTGWTYNPVVNSYGCGMNDSGEWTTDDTNWNSVVLSGTASRSGVIEVVVLHSDVNDYFYVDDVSIAEV